MGRADSVALREQLVEIVSAIPAGKWASYSGVGSAMLPPQSGRIVGQMMKRYGADLPWWRVVTVDGRIALMKLDPVAGKEQVERLRSEGVKYENDRLDREFHYHPLDYDR
ncbi:MAG: MGMT family protein [Fimbriimonadaceae bacterium]|nr:MGMT family protein [Fimbriimonadaceae bacterium]